MNITVYPEMKEKILELRRFPAIEFVNVEMRKFGISLGLKEILNLVDNVQSGHFDEYHKDIKLSKSSTIPVGTISVNVKNEIKIIEISSASELEKITKETY